MSEKKLVLPLSYTNIGDHGGLKTTSAGAAVHAPVRPVSTEYWLDLLSEDIPLHERKLIEYAKQLESNGKHCGWALEDSGRLLRVKGRWGVDIEVTVDQFATPPKDEYVGKDCVRRLLRKHGNGYYDVMAILGYLDPKGLMRFHVNRGAVYLYDLIAGTVHQITVTPYTTYVPSDRLFD